MNKKSQASGESLEIKISDSSIRILYQVIEFLGLFLPKTLSKRLVSIILLAIGIPVKTAVKLSGTSERSLWTLHKQLSQSNVSEIMVLHHGGGHTPKTAGIEDQIEAEIESGNYHTRQEIADMIFEKFHIKLSRSAVGSFLKKKELSG